VVIADDEKQARTFLGLYEQSCADPVEYIRKRGGDPKIVAANIAAWRTQFPMVPHTLRERGWYSPPSPAPPGSAGGAGTEI
jgi:hypothetical protein